MSFTQVITPNPNIPCKPGWCLEYVAKAFGVFGQGVGQPSATAAWQFALTKGTAHTDRNFDGLWVPVYFTLIGVPDGHIVVKAPDNSIYSSSSVTSNTPVYHTSIETLNQYYGGKLGLLGWSEDLNGIKIVKEESMVTIEQAVYNDLVQWKKDGIALAAQVKVLQKQLTAVGDTALAKETNSMVKQISNKITSILK